MKDIEKTKAQLIEELQGLRKQLQQLQPTAKETAVPDLALLASLVDQMLEPTVIIDWEGNLLHGNGLAAGVIGLGSPDDLVGMNLAGFVHPDSVAQAAEDLQQVKESEAEFSASYKLLINGRTVPIDSHGTKIELADGSVDLVSFRDVSRQRDTEKELRRHERLFESMVENAKELAIFQKFADASGQGFGMATLDGVVTYINQSVCRFTGLKKPDHGIGKQFVEFHPEEVRKQLSEEVVPAVLKRGEWTGEMPMQHIDGRTIPTILSMFLLRDEQGNPQQFAAVLTDIRDRKHTEEALVESEKRFRALAESTTAHISIMQDDRYVYANQAFLDYFEADSEDLLLINPEDMMMGMMGPESMKQAEAAWQAAQDSGDSRFSFEFQDLERSWFQTNVTTMELDGKLSYMAMNFDVTELKRAQTEMYRADKMASLGQIIAGVAHEINNPNNFIYFNLPILRKYIEAILPMLEHHLDDDPDLKVLNMPYQSFLVDVFKLLENMEHGSKRITGIVSELKSYVRSDEEGESMSGSVGPVIDRVMTLVGKQVRKMVSRFDVHVEEDLPTLAINPGKIEQVLINLVINAGQAADKDDSWVKLTARPVTDRGADYVEILVEDNGAGIPENIRDKIFDPFFTSKGREKGTGLGLSISHRIVEEHGGTIAVKSTPGEGTTFTIRLPVQVN